MPFDHVLASLSSEAVAANLVTQWRRSFEESSASGTRGGMGHARERIVIGMCGRISDGVIKPPRSNYKDHQIGDLESEQAAGSANQAKSAS